LLPDGFKRTGNRGHDLVGDPGDQLVGADVHPVDALVNEIGNVRVAGGSNISSLAAELISGRRRPVDQDFTNYLVKLSFLDPLVDFVDEGLESVTCGDFISLGQPLYRGLQRYGQRAGLALIQLAAAAVEQLHPVVSRAGRKVAVSASKSTVLVTTTNSSPLPELGPTPEAGNDPINPV